MRKLVSIIILLSIAWLAKLSYDMWQISRTVPELQQSLLQSEQQYANLNDQLVALKRQTQTQSSSDVQTAPLTNHEIIHTGITPTVVIKQKLDLIQFAIDQQQFIFAVDHLTQLQQSLPQYEIAPALQHSLNQAIEQDKQAIQQYVIAQNQRHQLIDDLLQTIDKNIQQALAQPKLEMDQSEAVSWWKKWFRIEKVETPSINLMNRSVVFKEVQLRLLIAEQALNQGKMAEYQNELQSVMQKLNELPDATSQQLKNRIAKVAHLSIVPVPKLSTLGLLGS
ncbi:MULTISPECIES: hypothetical protein [Acinetobacter calcoaceticus/baumannii complex]|uniref:hypothetical protein n=1 Tax=Acinetobacter calcoaceticus/baumannii complex TaxID=909768 RepID=UPI0004495885|nr:MULTISPECIES: hypothetical protein [Acinetobacter calcoaceticus/baumannii complex]EXR32550.1 hypothetical protein J689_2371 [Acinetobacter sp. 1179249]MBJ8464960.1 hypothetical protein [Acinetobacter nosocomialis]MBP1498754.1 hypothetical protein [Acinetobacter nosocomialis]MBR7690928.1 hypothetical protein [Acinetobacter nosocomialis]MBR7728841.1 hypothetical protein [Acinetobacter nosocomialis]